MLSRLTAATALCLATLLPTQVVAFQSEGWWVVLRTHPADSYRMTAEVAEAEAHGRSCGVKVWNEWSGKFVGFRPGYHVIVMRGEPFSTQQRAQAAVVQARRCYPDAYAKFARYLGE